MVICAAKLDNSLHTRKRKGLSRVSKHARSLRLLAQKVQSSPALKVARGMGKPLMVS